MIRTRFAPSPTGFLHVGGLRTALYNYLFARKNNGKFILRIEDTDRNRLVENAVPNLLKTLKWVGLEFDEGPFIQSERFEIYKKYADELLKNGHAYRCFCTMERLEKMRKEQERRREAPMYDRKCLTLSPEEIEKNIASNTPFVIRQKIPHNRTIKIEDLIRGNVFFDCKTIDDQILVKSDGFPTYHLANVIDDHLMEISHVIRGEEWLPSTPKHVFLYEAFEWKPPQFAHIPLLLNSDRTKLSKRQNDVSVEDYRNKSYLKEAIINFIAFLGWHPGKGITKEIYSLEELIKEFSLEQVHSAGAIFNLEKLNWYNWQWLRKIHFEKLDAIAHIQESTVKISTDVKGNYIYGFKKPETFEKFQLLRGAELLKIAEPHINPEWGKEYDLLLKTLVTIEEKILQQPPKTANHLKFYFTEPKFDEKLICNEKMKVDKATAKTSLQESLAALEKLSDYYQEEIQKTLMEIIKKLGFSNGQVLWPLRAALTGEQFSPGTFEIIWALGKNHTLTRLKSIINKF